MDRIQLRRDTSARWAEINPILLEGEVGYEIDTKLRKIGDGVNRWNDLEYLRAEGISQETGNSQNITMSQDAITRELSELGSVRPQLSITSFDTTEPVFTLDYSNKKLKVSENVRLFIISNKLLVDSGIDNNHSYETDFVGSISTNRLAFLVYSIEESKLYLVDFLKIHLYKEYNSEGERINYNIGSIIESRGAWCFGFNFGHINIDGKDYYGDSLTKAKEYTDELLKEYSTEKVLEKSVVSNSIIDITIPQKIGNQFFALVEGENIANVTTITSYIMKGTVDDNNFRQISIRRGDSGKLYIYGVYTEEDFENDRNKLRIYFNKVESETAIRVIHSMFPVGVQPNLLTDTSKYISKIRPTLTVSAFESVSPVFTLDYTNKKLKVDKDVRIFIMSGNAIIADTKSTEGYETDFVGTYTGSAAVNFIVFNNIEKKFYLVSYGSIHNYREVDPETGNIEHLYVGSISQQSNGIWAIGFNYSYIKIGSLDLYGDNTAKASEVENKLEIRPTLSIASYDTAAPSFTLDYTNKKLIVTDRIFVLSSNRVLHDTEKLEPYETDFVGTVNPKRVAYIVYKVSDKKLYLVDFASIGQFQEVQDYNRLHTYVGTIIQQWDNQWCLGFNFAHININGIDYYSATNLIPVTKEKVTFLPLSPDDAEFISKTRTENLFNKSTIVKGYYGEDGINFYPNSKYWCSDFMSVIPGETYKTNKDTSYYMYCYDADKNAVQVDGKGYWQPLASVFTIPEGVYYIRKLFTPANLDSVMFTLSTVDTSKYIPYYTYELDPDIKVSSSEDTAGVGISDFGMSDVGNVKYHEIGTCDYEQVIMYGQSLSMGWEAPEAIAEEPLDGVYMVGDKVAIRHGNNGSNTLNPLVSTMATSCGENPTVGAINAFVPMYRRFMNKNQKFIATSCGEGGKSIEQMSKESTNGTNWYNTEFITALNRTKATVDAESKTVGCFAILYMQGEYNYVHLSNAGLTSGTDATSDKNTYKAYLKTLKDNMQADVMAIYGQKEKPLFLIYEVAGSYINRFDMSINMAQVEFAMENDDVFLLPPTYPVPDYGGGHLSTNGYRWYGEMIAKSLYNVFVKGKRFYPIMPQKYTIEGRRIRVYFFVPVMPLVFDTWTKETITNMGFRVQVNDTDITISRVSIENNSVVIECDNDLTGKVAVAYAGQGRSGSGNLRDSDMWRSYYNYYDDTESSPNKRENYTPLDTPNGSKIYGKPYPMFNWCGNFYKLVQED